MISNAPRWNRALLALSSTLLLACQPPTPRLAPVEQPIASVEALEAYARSLRAGPRGALEARFSDHPLFSEGPFGAPPACTIDDTLILPGVTRLSEAEARIVAGTPTGCVLLPDLAELPADAAVQLGRIPLDGLGLHLDALTPVLADALTRQARTHANRRYLSSESRRAHPNLLFIATDPLELGEDTATHLADFLGERLLLHGVQRLTDASAEALSRVHVDVLSLPDLSTLEPAIAERLDAYQRRLVLDGLDQLSPDVARAIVKTRALSFAGLTTLSQETAAALAERIEPLEVLSLGGLTQLDPTLAQRLSELPAQHLVLNGLDVLDAEAARALTSGAVKHYTLDGLAAISMDAAAVLLDAPLELSLDGVEHIDPELARLIAPALPSRVSLSGLRELTPDTARALLKDTEHEVLHLPRLQQLTPEVAELLADAALEALDIGAPMLSPDALQHLSRVTGTLRLGITELTPAHVQSLAPGPRELDLYRLQSLDAESARTLTTLESKRVRLDAMPRLTPAVLDALSTLPEHAALSLRRLQGIDVATLKLLAERGVSVPLHRLRALTPEEAEQVGALLSSPRFKQDANLSGLLEFPPATADALASTLQRDAVLRLDGLTELTPEAAHTLASSRVNKLVLNGLTGLSVEVARALSANRWRLLVLNGVRELSDEAAELLFGSDARRISLQGLETISPRLLELSLSGPLVVDPRTIQPLTAAHAEVLVESGDQRLVLHHLDSLGIDAAEQLSRYSGERLILSLDSLSADAAAHLAGASTDLLQITLPSLEPEVAAALARFGGAELNLRLDEETVLDARVAHALGLSRAGEIEMVGLSLLTTEAAEGLARFVGHELDLDVTELEGVETARHLAGFGVKPVLKKKLLGMTRRRTRVKRRKLKLRNLQTLSAEEARALDAFYGRLQLKALRELNPDSARLFVKHGMPQFGPRTPEIDPETAAVLATWPGRRLELQKIEVLDAETARAIASFQGEAIWLTNLRTLTPEAAEALATFQGEELLLRRLKMTPELEDALEGFSGQLEGGP